MLTDVNGVKQQGYLFTPYGETWVTENNPSSLTSEVTRLFTGQEMDSETGLYYMNARYYDPVTATFISPDPAMQGLNHYGYCSANPIKYQDPTGMDDFTFGGDYSGGTSSGYVGGGDYSGSGYSGGGYTAGNYGYGSIPDSTVSTGLFSGAAQYTTTQGDTSWNLPFSYNYTTDYQNQPISSLGKDAAGFVANGLISSYNALDSMFGSVASPSHDVITSQPVQILPWQCCL